MNIELAFASIGAAAVLAAAATTTTNAAPQRPGKTPETKTTMVIFAVSAKGAGNEISRASVTCEFVHKRYQKFTNNSGTASIAFRLPPPMSAERAECIVVKRGYDPVHKRLDVMEMTSPTLMNIELKPTA